MTRSGSCPMHCPCKAVPARPGGLAEPEALGTIPSIWSMYHSHFCLERPGSDGSSAMADSSSQPTQAARVEPSRAALYLSPEKELPELPQIHNNRCQQDWSCRMSQASSEVAPAPQAHSSCRLQHGHHPASPAHEVESSMPRPSSAHALQFRPCGLGCLIVQTKKPLKQQNSLLHAEDFRVLFPFIRSQHDSSFET